MRVVSLLPSATEILFAVGAGDAVVGVTFECDHPPEARTRRIVSTTTLPEGLTPAEIDREVSTRVAAGEDLYHLDEGALREIDPTLVVTQDLCAVCAVDVENVDAALDHLGCHAQVLTLDPMTLDAVLESIQRVGDAVSARERADTVVASLRARLDAVARALDGRPRPRVAMLEWTDPPFSSGHWVPDMVTAAGGVSVLGESGMQSARTTWGAVVAADPEVVVVAPCGFDLTGATALARDLVAADVLPHRLPVWAVDADAAFVRPGPRVVDGVETLAGFLHPEAASERPELATLVRG